MDSTPQSMALIHELFYVHHLQFDWHDLGIVFLTRAASLSALVFLAQASAMSTSHGPLHARKLELF